MSTSLPAADASLPAAGGPGATSLAGGSSTLRVEVTFRDVHEQQAEAIAAELVGRVHELANLPEYECDVDVSVQTTSSQVDGAHASGAL